MKASYYVFVLWITGLCGLALCTGKSNTKISYLSVAKMFKFLGFPMLLSSWIITSQESLMWFASALYASVTGRTFWKEDLGFRIRMQLVSWLVLRLWPHAWPCQRRGWKSDDPQQLLHSESLWQRGGTFFYPYPPNLCHMQLPSGWKVGAGWEGKNISRLNGEKISFGSLCDICFFLSLFLSLSLSPLITLPPSLYFSLSPSSTLSFFLSGTCHGFGCRME